MTTMITATHVSVMTGSDSFILTSTAPERKLDTPDRVGQELRLTLTIQWEEYRDPGQKAGSLWLEYLLGKQTTELPGIEAVVPIETQGPRHKTFLVATPGNVRIHYTGEAKAHVWLSYYAEYMD